MALDDESVSPNESEPDSASLRHLRVAILPEMKKPVIGEEEMSSCTHRTQSRGGWGGRVLKRMTMEHWETRRGVR